MNWTQSDTDVATFVVGVVCMIVGGSFLWGWAGAILIAGIPLTICPWVKHMVRGHE